MVPYMHDFHNTANAWQPNWNPLTGWYLPIPKRRETTHPLPDSVLDDLDSRLLDEPELDDAKLSLSETPGQDAPPEWVPPVERLECDIRALLTLMTLPSPLCWPVQRT